MKVTVVLIAVVKSCLIDMFEARDVLSKVEVCDQIQNKWMIYQNEHIPQIVYVKMQKVKIKAVLQESFLGLFS